MILLYLGAAYASSSFQQRDDLASSTNPSGSLFTDRSIYSIIWSCLATIFACTWISVHPNLPAPQDGALRIIGRRIAIMTYLLTAPEMVIIWTTRQYIGASEISKRHKDKGWTKVQAFFLLMGGFSLYEDGVLLRTLEVVEFEKLLKEGRIEWPAITVEEIKDKSNGDPFSKGVVILQTSWFIIQCIVRGSKHMVLTELEVVTLAFSVLTMTIYALWWHKPLDVSVSVPVHLKSAVADDENKLPVQDEIAEPHAGEQSQLLATTLDGFHVTTRERSPSSDGEEPIQNKEETQAPAFVPLAQKKPFCDPNLTPLQNFRRYVRAKQEELGIFFAVIYVFILRPGVIFFGPFVDMLGCTTLDGNQFRVPTFYSPEVEDDSLSIMLGILVALLFGGMHCIAWSFHFASWAERWIWRISAVLVSGLPVSISIFSVILDMENPENSRVWGAIWDVVLPLFLISSAILYIAARMALLVLPIIALRSLPPGAYVDINWTNYLPHI